MNFYIADTHLGHGNIIRHSRRDLNYGVHTVEEMDALIIKNWNEAVGDDDDVYIVGDFIYKSDDPLGYIKQLKGHKHLIKGNHDRYIKNRAMWKYFDSIDDIKMIQDGTTQLVLFHYPMAEWPGYYRNSVLLYGHIHNNENEACKIMAGLKNCYNVGADIPFMGLTPRTLNHIIKNGGK